MSQKRFLEVEDVSADTPADLSERTSKKLKKETNASARRSLFVRSLPPTVSTTDLTDLFSQSFPLKHATVVLDTDTKQSKGYGFVTFADAEDAQRALDEFNGKVIKGKKMKIDIAEPRSREAKTRAVFGGEIVAKEPKKKGIISLEAGQKKKERLAKLVEQKAPPKLIIRNLPWSIKTPDQLAEMFREYGKVKLATIPKSKGDTQKGFGFIVMRGKKNAEKALMAVNGMEVDGRTLAVDWAVEKKVWEAQTGRGNQVDHEDEEAGEVEEEEEASLENGFSERRMPSLDPEDEGEDLANFFETFGDLLESEDEEDAEAIELSEEENKDFMTDRSDDSNNVVSDGEEDLELATPIREKVIVTDNSTTLFIRNVPFTVLDKQLKEQFENFGPVRYARVVMDRATERPKGTAFVCFFNIEDANKCFYGAPKHTITGANAIKADPSSKVKHSILVDENEDRTGLYTIDGRVLQVSRAVEKEKAVKLTEDGVKHRTGRDEDKRRLYLLSEGTVSAGTTLYAALAPSEIKMREDSASQRKKLIQNNPTLHLSLTRLSVRNLPRDVDSKSLKALAREAVVGFATDVKNGVRPQLSKEEEARGGDEMRETEKQRKAKGKGIVRQSKIVFEGREGAKVTEESGAGRSRGYGFIEYSSHRWALMGLRWLNGHALTSSTGKKQRLVVEFAIENAQVVQRRKEKEEKARLRSAEVSAERERALKEGKKIEKKSLTVDQKMKRTRVGQKGVGNAIKGVKDAMKYKPGKFGKRNVTGPDRMSDGHKKRFMTDAEKTAKFTHLKNDGGRGGDNKSSKIASTKKNAKFNDGKGIRGGKKDEALADRSRIIMKKRQQRKAKKS